MLLRDLLGVLSHLEGSHHHYVLEPGRYEPVPHRVEVAEAPVVVVRREPEEQDRPEWANAGLILDLHLLSGGSWRRVGVLRDLCTAAEQSPWSAWNRAVATHFMATPGAVLVAMPSEQEAFGGGEGACAEASCWGLGELDAGVDEALVMAEALLGATGMPLWAAVPDRDLAESAARGRWGDDPLMSAAVAPPEGLTPSSRRPHIARAS